MASHALASERTIGSLVRGCAARYGERPFLYFRDEVFSFAELDRFSDRVAKGMFGLGIAKGDKVGLMMSNKPEFLVGWFGLAKIGGVEVPINTGHRGYLLTYMLDTSDCKALVMDAALLPHLNEVLDDLQKLVTVIIVGEGELPADSSTRRWHRWQDVVSNDGAAVPVEVYWDDPFTLMFTSGTTGPSKGSVMPHNYPWTTGETMIHAGGYTEADCLYNVLPLFHGNAQVLQTIPAMMVGARMVLRDHFSASAFWSDIRRYGCTVFNYLGTILSVLIKAEPSPGDRDHGLRVMVGAGCGGELFTAVEKRFGVPLIESYGMSEIGMPLTSSANSRKPGSCGRRSEHFDILLVDDDMQPVGPNIRGELLVRPTRPLAMLLGYYGMPEKTVEAWQDLWFHTGDYLQCDEEGFYTFVDRKKDAIRRRGENISSFELERSVGAHPQVFECAAIPAPSELGEDEAMVCVVLKPGAELTPLELSTWCEKQMAAFMVPRYYRFMTALPKTPTQRVEKFRLREQGVTADTWDKGDPRR